MADKKEPNVEDKVKEIRPFPKWVSILIVIISLLEVVFIISLFSISLFKQIPFHCFEKEIESSLLGDGVAIIGVAIAVWAGLNIANAIERKDYDILKKDIEQQISDTEKKLGELHNEYNAILEKEESRIQKQLMSEKAKLIDEISRSTNDLATRYLMVMVSKCKIDENISFLRLVEMEHLFHIVLGRHSSGYKEDNALLYFTDKGIMIATEEISKTVDKILLAYLQFRIAEFNYYKGYCLKEKNRKETFLKAIEKYELSCKDLGAFLPTYNEKFNCPYKDDEYEKCDSHPLDISAYMCNTIGDSYSKIVEEKEDLIKEGTPESEIDDYSKKAIFYCAYASHWVNREIYWRNLGCAIERAYGINKDTPYDDLVAIYNRAFELQATKKSFKTLLSILQKYLAFGFDIGNADPDKGRKIPLNDIKYFDYYSNSISVNKVKMDDMLKELCNYSSKAKTIYPSDTVGYDYSCFYHLYECIINQGNHAEINRHKEQAKEDLQILKILAPNAALTKIFEKDLSVF